MTSTSSSSGCERPVKKLRSSQPDCKVTLKWSDRDGDHEEEIPYHSVILANISTIADNAFENDNGVKEIVFGVEPLTFHQAMKFLQDPLETRSMGVDQVFDVVGFYHKYDFSDGLRLCDQVMKEYFEKCKKEKNFDFEMEFDELIDNVLWADKYHLQKAFKVGVAFLQKKLDSMAAPFGCTMFTEGDAKKLQDLFVRGILKCPGISKQEELESDMFPRLMVLSLQSYFMTCRVPQQLTVSGTDSEADGKYKYNLTTGEYEAIDGRKGYINGEEVEFFIEKSYDSNAWDISARRVDDEDTEEIPLYWCPCSYNLPYPPTGPWSNHYMGEEGKVVQIVHSKMRY